MISKTLDWIEKMVRVYKVAPGLVLDVGSRENTASKGTSTSPRRLFPGSTYIGIDRTPGLNVDRIMSAYDLSRNFEGGMFDAVLCLHVLEHLVNPWVAVEQINWVLRKGGLFFCAMPEFGYPLHEGRRGGDAQDYWRASEDAVREFIFGDYDILELEHAKSPFGKHPFIHCLGVRK